MEKKPTIDQDKCIGCGACVSVCQDVFKLTKEGKAKVKENYPKNASCIEEAAAGCPVQAIKLKKD